MNELCKSCTHHVFLTPTDTGKRIRVTKVCHENSRPTCALLMPEPSEKCPSFAETLSVMSKYDQKTIYQTTGENIKALRISRGMSQVDLAAKFEIASTTVGAWEHGICLPGALVLIALCELFDTDLLELTGRKEHAHD